MRTLMRAMILGTLFMGLLSCGNPEEENKRKSNSIPGIISNGVGTVYQDFNELKKAFQDAGFNQGLEANAVVYHIGEKYGGSSNTNNFSASASFCIGGENLFGDDGVCDGSTAYNNQLNSVISNGEYKVVRSATSASVEYGVASSVSDGGFEFFDRVFDINDEDYRKMLNLDNKEYNKVVVTAATVGTNTASNIKANLVEYFFKDGTYEAYIVSTALPKMANPLVSYSGNYNQGGGVSFQMKGRLFNISENKLVRMSAQSHGLMYNVQTNQFTVTRGTNLY